MSENKTMWAERIGHELYVFWRGIPIYKRWNKKDDSKSQPSRLFNDNGWPNEEII